MKDSTPIPTTLHIVAVFFLLYGIGSIIGMVVHLVFAHIRIDFGFLGIPAYFGLRRFSTGWRTFTLYCIWMLLIMSPISFIAGLVPDSSARLEMFGYHFAHIKPIWISVLSVPMFLLALWQYRVLTRPDILRLFLPPPYMINHRA